MRVIESNEPELIREYSKLHRLMTENSIDGFIGTVHGQETLRVFVHMNGKFHMVRFEDIPIIGKYPWDQVDVYVMNNLITIDVTGGKDMYSTGEPILTIKSRQGDPDDIKSAINVLKEHNKWRKGDDSIKPTDPTELGNAIDLIVNFVEDRLKHD